MDKYEEIKAEVASLTNVAKYVEDACPTGAAVIIHARDKLLEMLSKSESVTPEWLEEIKALAQAATPGPWMLSETDAYAEVWVKNCNENGEMPLALVGGTFKDAEFIARSREAIPRLLAEVERLTGERDAAVRRAEAAEAALQLAGIKIAQLSQCAPQPYSHVMPTAFEPTMTEVTNGTAEGRPRR